MAGLSESATAAVAAESLAGVVESARTAGSGLEPREAVLITKHQHEKP